MIAYLFPDGIGEAINVTSGNGECDQLAWVFPGQCAQHSGIDDAENGSVRPYAQSEREHGREREIGIRDERAQAVAQILSKRVEQIPAPSLGAHLAKIRLIAELAIGSELGVLRRHSRCLLIRGNQVNVELHLFGEFLIELFATKPVDDPAK